MASGVNEMAIQRRLLRGSVIASSKVFPRLTDTVWPGKNGDGK